MEIHFHLNILLKMKLKENFKLKLFFHLINKEKVFQTKFSKIYNQHFACKAFVVQILQSHHSKPKQSNLSNFFSFYMDYILFFQDNYNIALLYKKLLII